MPAPLAANASCSSAWSAAFSPNPPDHDTPVQWMSLPAELMMSGLSASRMLAVATPVPSRRATRTSASSASGSTIASGFTRATNSPVAWLAPTLQPSANPVFLPGRTIVTESTGSKRSTPPSVQPLSTTTTSATTPVEASTALTLRSSHGSSPYASTTTVMEGTSAGVSIDGLFQTATVALRALPGATVVAG